MSLPSTRRVFRRTDTSDPSLPKLQLLTEPLPSPLPPHSVLVKVSAVSLNYRDANIVNGNNPWPVIPRGIPGSDAFGTVLATGPSITSLSPGDPVITTVDQASITGREPNRRWLAADLDGVLADYIVSDASLLTKAPSLLSPREAATLSCSVLTAWNALRGITLGNTVLIQGTGGVSLAAIKLAQSSGARVILTSSSDEKLAAMRQRFGPNLLTVNYATDPSWHESVLALTGNRGVDLVLENGGASSLVRSIACTRRGGTVSQVGYLDKHTDGALDGLVPILIDRRVNLRGINGGSKHDLEDLCAAVEATQMRFHDTIDRVFPFEESEEAIDFVWQGKQVGKVVLEL